MKDLVKLFRSRLPLNPRRTKPSPAAAIIFPEQAVFCTVF